MQSERVGPRSDYACPIVYKGWGRKKGWGREKRKKKSVTDKIKSQTITAHRFFASFATDQNKILPPSTTNP